MFPKEHGAWNALWVSLAAGWTTLGECNSAALAASLLWLSVFTLRAPWSTARQYRTVDPGRARRALVFFWFLLVVSILSAWVFWKTAPLPSLQLVLLAAVPVGLVLLFLVLGKPNLRFLLAEVLGFAGLCLAAPVLHLTRDSASAQAALLLYILFAGYFLNALFYVRIRRDWLVRSRTGERTDARQRFRDLRGVLFWGGVLALVAVLYPKGDPRLVAGPLYACGRSLWTAWKGKAGTPMMRLGFQELTHSLVYLALTLATGSVFYPS